MWTENFQIYKLDLEKAEEPDCQHLLGHGESKGIPKNIYFCFIDYAKGFDFVDHNKLWKILQEMGISATWHASWEICTQVKKQQLDPDMEQWTGSKLGKEYVKAYIVNLLI